MSAGFFSTIFRFLIFFLNFAFVTLGAVTFGYGLKLHNVAAKTAEVTEPDATPMFLMILGGLVFVVAFFGCCGAFKESSCMLRTYAICVLILLILQLLVAYRVYQKPEMVKESIKKNLEDFLQQYGKNNVTTRFMDDTQQSFKCCGVYGPKDYLEMSKSVIPESCCEKSSDDATKCDVNTAFQEGCYEQLKQAFIDNLKILKFVGLFVIVFQALSVLISFCLANNIRRAYDVV